MTSRTHDLIALSSLVTVAATFPPPPQTAATLITALIACDIGSLIPDMDQASNRLWDLFPGGNFVGKIGRHLFLSHRTLSHSLLGVFLIYQLLSWLLPKFLNPAFINPYVITLAVMIGLLSHLAADSLTEEGIPLFFPFTFKIGFPPIRSWRIKTGKWFEKFVIVPAVIIYLIWFVQAHSVQLLSLFSPATT